MKSDNSFLKDVLDNLADGIVVADAAGNFVLFNQAAEKIMGHGAQQVPPREWTNAYGIYKSDQVTPYPADELPLVLAMKGETVIDELLFIKNPTNLEGRWINVSANPIYNDQDEITAGAVIFKDVTERVKTLEQLELDYLLIRNDIRSYQVNPDTQSFQFSQIYTLIYAYMRVIEE